MEWNEIIMDVVKTCIVLATFIITRYLVPWLKAQIENSEYKWMATIVEDAVKYAEQTIRESGKGEEKKALVLEFIQNQLTIKGIKVTDEQLDALIESAVFGLKKGAENG